MHYLFSSTNILLLLMASMYYMPYISEEIFYFLHNLVFYAVFCCQPIDIWLVEIFNNLDLFILFTIGFLLILNYYCKNSFFYLFFVFFLINCLYYVYYLWLRYNYTSVSFFMITMFILLFTSLFIFFIDRLNQIFSIIYLKFKNLKLRLKK